MSAVSNSITPASSAACTTFCVAAASSRMPKLLQPRPTAETCKPVCANSRCSMSAIRQSEKARRITAEDLLAVLRRNVERLDARHAVEIAHVEGIIAAEQHVLHAG